MKRRLAYHCISAGVILYLLCVAALPAAAQEGQEGKASEPGAAKSKPQPVAKGGPAPRTPDGHPDLSGVWFPGTAGGFTFNPALRRQFDAKSNARGTSSFPALGGRKNQGDDHN